MNISAVILTKNSEKTIKKAIKSLDFCDEIVVIDDRSDDQTKIFAEKFGAKVYIRKLDDYWAKQRNFALSKVKYDWVLYLDSDEKISGELRNNILSAIKSEKYDGYFLHRSDIFMGHKMKGTEAGSIYLLRLARREKGIWVRKIHEYWNIFGKTKKLNGWIYHYSHQSLNVFISSINRMSTIHANENMNESKLSSITKIVFYPILKFINNMTIKKGLIDMTYGFVFSVMMSFHSYLAWSKLWLIQKRKK